MSTILVGCLFVALFICVAFVYIQVVEAHQNNQVLYDELEQLKEQIRKLGRHNRIRARSEVIK